MRVATPRSCRLLVAIVIVAASVSVPRSEAGASSSHAAAYVAEVFQIFLGRAPSPAEVDQATAMSMTSPTGRLRLVTNLTTSGPWYFLTVADRYQKILGRSADPGGLGYWVNALAYHRTTLGSFDAALYASAEYASRTDVRGWVGRLYVAVLGRSADPAGLDYWVDVAARSGRTQAARNLYGSAEAARRRVTLDYQRVLGRAPDAAGLDQWSAIEARLGDTLVAARLAASAEAYGPLQPGETVVAAPAPPLAEQLAGNALATKVVTVQAAGWGSTTASFAGWQRTVVGWRQVLGSWTAHNGSRGWERPLQRREGNGTTPVGRYGFQGGFGLASNPGYRLGWFTVTARDYWTSDPSRADYNTHAWGPTNPAYAPWSSSEHLIDFPVAYRYAAVIDFNSPPTGPYGSAIFLHVSTGGPTAGCVSLPESQLLSVLRWIDAGTQIVMGPDSVIRGL